MSQKYPFIIDCRDARRDARIAGAIFVAGIVAALALLFGAPEIYAAAVQAGWVRP